MIETFTALAEPNRLRIVELLRDGPRPVGALVDALRLNQPQVSKHLRVLKESGLVEVEADAQQRVYALRPEPLRELDAWLERYRRVWDERMDRLDDVVQELKARRAARTRAARRRR